MDILLNIWYIISGIIGIVLAIGGILCLILGSIVIIMGISISIKDKEYDMIPMCLGISVFCIIFALTSWFVNTNVVKDQKQITNEIVNIVSYEGINNIKDGKYNYDYLYFTQGINNDYKILKLDPNKCKLHYTNESNIKIVENHTEYLSKFRYLALFSLEENINYDIYLPEKYKV